MNTLPNIPMSEVLSVVEEALRADATNINVVKQDDGNYTVSWE